MTAMNKTEEVLEAFAEAQGIPAGGERYYAGEGLHFDGAKEGWAKRDARNAEIDKENRLRRPPPAKDWRPLERDGLRVCSGYVTNAPHWAPVDSFRISGKSFDVAMCATCREVARVRREMRSQGWELGRVEQIDEEKSVVTVVVWRGARRMFVGVGSHFVGEQVWIRQTDSGVVDQETKKPIVRTEVERLMWDRGGRRGPR